MTKREKKIIIGVGLVILLFVSLVGQWRSKVIITQENITKSSQSMVGYIEKRQYLLFDIVTFLLKDSSKNKQIAKLHQYLKGMRVENNFESVLLNAEAHERFFLEQQQLTTVTKDVLKYGATQRALMENPEYRKRAKRLYYVNLQIYHEQLRLNQEINYLNKKTSGFYYGFLNRVFINAEPHVPFGEIVTKDIEEDKKYLTFRMAR